MRGRTLYFIKDNKRLVDNIIDSRTKEAIADERFILNLFGKSATIVEASSYWQEANSLGLTHAEALSLRCYSEDYFQTINHALWNGINSEEVQNYTRVLNRALDKLDAYQGQVFRGAPLSMAQLDEYRKYVKNGLPMPHHGFISTSIKENVAIGFTPNTMIYIKSKSGKDISRISNSEREYEVLFKSGTEFKIISVGEGVEFGERVFKIEMEEI